MLNNSIKNPTQECLQELIQSIPYFDDRNTNSSNILFALHGLIAYNPNDRRCDAYKRQCLNLDILPFSYCHVLQNGSFVQSQDYGLYTFYDDKTKIKTGALDDLTILTKPSLLSMIELTSMNINFSQDQNMYRDFLLELQNKDYSVIKFELNPISNFNRESVISICYNSICGNDVSLIELKNNGRLIKQLGVSHFLSRLQNWFDKLKQKYNGGYNE